MTTLHRTFVNRLTPASGSRAVIQRGEAGFVAESDGSGLRFRKPDRSEVYVAVLPDVAGNNAKVLGVVDGDLAWVEQSGGDTLGVLNVLDYGATGDGVTDDTDAFNLAFAAAVTAKGGVVFVPPGRYVVKKTVLACEGVNEGRFILRGCGGASVIIPKPNLDGLPTMRFNYAYGGIDVEDLWFDGESTQANGSPSSTPTNVLHFLASDARVARCNFRRLTIPSGSLITNYDGYLAVERLYCENNVIIGDQNLTANGYIANLKYLFGWRGFSARDCWFSQNFGAFGLSPHGIYFGDPASYVQSSLDDHGSVFSSAELGYVQHAAGGEPAIAIRYDQDQIPCVIERVHVGCTYRGAIVFSPSNTGRYSRIAIRDSNLSVFDGVVKSIVVKQADYLDIERVWMGTGGYGTWFAGIQLDGIKAARVSHCYLDGDDLYRPPIQGGVAISAVNCGSLLVEETRCDSITSDCPTTVVQDGKRATLFAGELVDTGALVKIGASGAVHLETDDDASARLGIAQLGTAKASGYVLFMVPGSITEGDSWTISDGTNVKTIRLTLNNGSYPGDVVVSGSLTDTGDQWATAFANAVNAAHGVGWKITASAVGGGSGKATVTNDDEGEAGNVITTSSGNVKIPNVSTVVGAVRFAGMAGGRSMATVITSGPANALSDGTTVIAAGDQVEPSATVAGRVRKGTTNAIGVATAGAAATVGATVAMVVR